MITELDDTESHYQLIISMTKFNKEGEKLPEKEKTTVLIARHAKQLNIQVQLTRYSTRACTYCPITY